MMEFLLSHIDAVITTALGLCFIILAGLKREAIAASSNPLTRQLPKLAPVLLIFGIVLFILPAEEKQQAQREQKQPAQQEPQERDGWVQVQFEDGVAWAEFPEPPKKDVVETPLGSLVIKRQTHVLTLADEQLNLRFSFSDHLPSTERLSDKQRMADIRRQLLEGGFEIEDTSVDEQGIHMVAAVHKGKNVQMKMRVAFTEKGTYRVVSTSKAGGEHDDIIKRFIASFSMSQAG